MTKSPELILRYSYEKHGTEKAKELFEGMTHEEITQSIEKTRRDLKAMHNNKKRRAEKLAFLDALEMELGGSLEAY